MKGKLRLGRALVITLALLLVAAAGFGASWAWSTHNVRQENILQSRTVDVTITENFPDPTVKAGATMTKAVTLKNSGTAAAFVRVCYGQYWTTADAQLSDTDAVTLNWTAPSDWEDGDDGWLYYKRVLPAGTTVQLLNSVTFPASVPAGTDYHLNFQVESVQVSDEEAVNTDATRTLFGRTATLSGAKIENGAVVSGSVSWN